MSIESERRDIASLNAAYQRDLDAIGREYKAAYAAFEARIEARQAQHRSASENVARREGIGLTQAQTTLGVILSRPGLDQLRRK